MKSYGLRLPISMPKHKKSCQVSNLLTLPRVKEVHRFLGMTSGYLRFGPEFAATVDCSNMFVRKRNIVRRRKSNNSVLNYSSVAQHKPPCSVAATLPGIFDYKPIQVMYSTNSSDSRNTERREGNCPVENCIDIFQGHRMKMRVSHRYSV